jgi:hypothetical protein
MLAFFVKCPNLSESCVLLTIPVEPLTIAGLKGSPNLLKKSK